MKYKCTCGREFNSEKEWRIHKVIITPSRPSAYLLCKNKITQEKYNEAERFYNKANTAHQPVLSEKELNKGLKLAGIVHN